MSAPRAYLIALLLGALASCGFAPLELWPLTLLSLAGLIGLIGRAGTLRRALGTGWWFGFGHFCVGDNWIATAFTYQAAMPAWLGWIAVALLSLYLAIFPMLATGAAWTLARGGTRGRLICLLAASWTITEWLRATLFTGFAWNPLGVIWVPNDLVPLAARWIGTYGLSGLTILITGLILQCVTQLQGRRGRARRRPAIACATLLAATALLLMPRTPGPRIPPRGLRMRIVQPNINQAEKWQPAFQARNAARLAALTGPPDGEPRLVLWPEAAVPEYLEEEPDARARLARLLGPRDLLLTGGIALRYDKGGALVAATNSLFGLDPSGRLLARYDKSHLVPYGEYLPMRPLLSRIGLSRLAPGDIDFDAGPGARDLTLPGIGKVGVQICYEIIFSGRVIDRAARPRFLFNPSNDAWFGAWGPPQHLAQARLRAIEEGLPVVRATPTGISAVVAADGRVVTSLPWHKAGAIDTRLPDPDPPTPFARFGNLLPLGFAILIGLLGFASRRRRR